jgi:hypothetical protein
MNREAVEKIANAVLYEGYLLYPYRASAVKNRQRFNFGVLYPPEYGETSEMTTECLVLGTGATMVEVTVRFLQMSMCEERQEGREREVHAPPCAPGSTWRQPFRFDAIEGELELRSAPVSGGVFQIRLGIRNLVDLETGEATREEVLLRSLVSVHSILQVTGGEFVSLLDPPEHLEDAAARCRNIGAWPVLAGDEGQRNLMLSSPIILYDYPRIAPESPGDLFDGLEIDEILALRILTLTDEEKREVRSGDERARRILERTETLPPEHLQRLHGALRGLRSVP